MPSSPPRDESDSAPRIVGAEAQLFVADVLASCDYYRSTLGFTVALVYGDPPYHAQVHLDTAKLNLRHVDEPVFVGDIREREQLLSASITIHSATDVRSLFASYRDAGVDFHQTLTQQPWGASTFIVRDPDGNLILFAAPA